MEKVFGEGDSAVAFSNLIRERGTASTLFADYIGRYFSDFVNKIQKSLSNPPREWRRSLSRHAKRKTLSGFLFFAEAGGFELPDRVNGLLFSRQVPSTTQPHLLVLLVGVASCPPGPFPLTHSLSLVMVSPELELFRIGWNVKKFTFHSHTSSLYFLLFKSKSSNYCILYIFWFFVCYIKNIKDIKDW